MFVTVTRSLKGDDTKNLCYVNVNHIMFYRRSSGVGETRIHFTNGETMTIVEDVGKLQERMDKVLEVLYPIGQM